jgi:hypothetical protein
VRQQALVSHIKPMDDERSSTDPSLGCHEAAGIGLSYKPMDDERSSTDSFIGMP